MLYLVGTPIGNLADFSARAKEILSSVDVIACEDTRRTGMLLAAFDIHNKLMSYHEHNRVKQGEQIIRMLHEGKNIALVSDAGMPCISDPGETLVAACAQEKIEISVVPGPVAGISELALSGLDSTHFFFEGFLPSSGKPRRERLDVLTTLTCTCILYEAPHRLLKTLTDFVDMGLGDRKIAVCRELTKKYEEVLRGSVEESREHFAAIPPKGEFVLVISGADKQNLSKPELTQENKEMRIRELHSEGLSTKAISQILSQEWNESKKSIYAYVIKMLQCPET